MDKTELNTLVGLSYCSCWKNLTTVHFQELTFLDIEVYPMLQSVGMANGAEPEGVVWYVETTEKSRQSIH